MPDLARHAVPSEPTLFDLQGRPAVERPGSQARRPPSTPLDTQPPGLNGEQEVGTALVPMTAGGHGAGMHDAPRTDWRAQRIGPAPAREIVDLRTRTCTDLAVSAGVPPALLDPGADATATREGLRAFAVAAVQPVIGQIAELASELLEIEVSIDVPSGWLGRAGAGAGVPGAGRPGRQP